MRSGTHHAEIIEHEGEFIGINLGWDFTAEHEWGIKNLMSAFGISGVVRKKGVFIPRDTIGLRARKTNHVPNDLVILEKGKETYLIYMPSYGPQYALTDATKKKDLDRIVSAYGEHEMHTAWDGGTFGIRVTGPDLRKKLRELYSAFENKDIVILMSGRGNNPFANSGLCLLIASKLPESFDKELGEADQDSLNLKDAFKKTGIEYRLQKAGCRYFALSPKWANEEKTELVFWLNPMEQNIHNSAWVTMADLEDWMEGKGKIMKEKA